MSGGTEAEATRARPLSGGLWTLFSWLRRDEHSSTDSVSSAGSARTAVSFAFLAPAHYGRAAAAPAPRPPPSPPSDSYRRRVRERSLRRQRDRDLTLHRKYGLGFDGGSLPVAAARRPDERVRRANSESPRAHVPGKRRAPPPPAPAATLPRRRARKRPAPPPPAAPRQPPAPRPDPAPMHRLPAPDERPSRSRDEPTGCKPEKYSKKDTQTKESKDVKIRSEKSFLKHIFENKKRNSAIDTSIVKLLPSISELDKQAAEMIEKYRLKEMTSTDEPEREIGKNDSACSSVRQQGAWICTRCLKKYDSTVITCSYCLPVNKSNDPSKTSKVSSNCTQTKNNLNKTSGSSRGNIEDKEKLKEILKEMKNSLPKRPKSEVITSNKIKNTSDTETKEDYPKIEASTLRIGSSISVDKRPVIEASTSGVVREQSTSSQNVNKENSDALTTINSVIVTQPVVLVHTKENVVLNDIIVNRDNPDRPLVKSNATKIIKDPPNSHIRETERKNPSNDPKPLNVISKTKYDLNTPLKISSLLNPIYIPKTTSTTNTDAKLVKQVDVKDIKNEKTNLNCKPQPNTTENILKITLPPPLTTLPAAPLLNKDDKPIPETKKNLDVTKSATSDKAQVEMNDTKPKSSEVKSSNILVKASPPSNTEPSTSKEDRLDQHARRRDLINQLERSIAKGDEKAAADAAVKLAQLKLSCSVLSFSSQIVGEASTSQPVNVSKTEKNIRNTEVKKVDEVTQKSSAKMPPENVEQIIENIVKQNIDKKNEAKQNIESKNGIKPSNEKKNDVKQPTPTAKEIAQVQPSTTPIVSARSKDESKKQTEGNTEATKTVNSKPSEASTSKAGSLKQGNEDDIVPIMVWVEDKEATRGPVPLQVRRGAALGDLRAQAERALGLGARLQRWIVGRALCSDDAAPLAALAGPDLAAPFYLCLVEPDTKTIRKDKTELEVKDPGDVYNELMKLEKQPLVANAEAFECGVCMERCAPGGGAVLRECVHAFCRPCLADMVRHCEDAVVGCPAPACRASLQDREVRALLPAAEYERWLARGLAAAESGSRHAFHCRTRDCSGWALCEPGVRRFPCPVCKAANCVPCQAIHEGETCEQHRAKLEAAASTEAGQTDEGTRALLTSLIARGEALECPECSAIITKKWGCDWIKCSACKTEICWVTRGRRWGPAGRGDTSAGCRCGVDGKKCHPSCGYCH